MPVRTIDATSEDARISGERTRCRTVFEIKVSWSDR
jgi:hypothetical protein